jgi:hypothetical protein
MRRIYRWTIRKVVGPMLAHHHAPYHR